MAGALAVDARRREHPRGPEKSGGRGGPWEKQMDLVVEWVGSRRLMSAAVAAAALT
jgi:hypothetical protein